MRQFLPVPNGLPTVASDCAKRRCNLSDQINFNIFKKNVKRCNIMLKLR